MKRFFKSIGALLSAVVLMFGIANQASAETVSSANLLSEIEISVNELGEVVFDDMNVQNAINELSNETYSSDLSESCCKTGVGCTCNSGC